MEAKRTTRKPFLIGIIVTILFSCTAATAANKVVVIPLKSNTAPCTGVDEVFSAGQCWKDRNLGASQVATSMSDSAAYGDYYQWGRLGDGHQNKTSQNYALQPSANDSPGHPYFITVSNPPFDWRNPQNDILWQGLGGINNPCPQGFRIPTIAEWQTEMASWSSSDAAGAFASPLKLVLAGLRSYTDGAISGADSYGDYWSSTTFGADLATAIGFGASSSLLFGTDRANGLSIRCIKD